ncbi:MAG: FtsX-like permease family protein [Actinomycetes bacterium]
MWRVVLRGIIRHKLRVALTGLAIILGVTFVTGTLVLTDTLRNTFTSLFSQVYAHVDLEVRGVAAFDQGPNGGTVRKPIDESLLTRVRSVPGVKVADGGVSGYAQFVGKDGKAITTGGAPTIGATFSPDRELSALTVVEGHGPRGDHEVVMDRGTARTHHFAVGDRVKILLAGPPQRFTISGIASFGSADNLAGATLAAFNLATAQKVFNSPGKLDAIEVVAAPGTTVTELKRSIATILPSGVEVVTGKTVADEQSGAINSALGFFSTALLVFAAISLFVGAFTIFNTFSITVGQRTRELALLRVIGASRRQVFLSVVGEALLLGVLSSIIGLGLGVLTAMGLEAMLSAFGVTLPKGALVFEFRTVVAGLAVGIGVTVVSAISPARRAVRIPPIAALSSYQGVAAESSRRRIILGALIGLGGLALLGVGLSSPAIALVGLGALAIFLAAGMLSPLAAKPVASIVGKPLARLFKVAGKLGRENSMRSPRRTAQTASALMVGLALVSTMAVFGASLSKSATRSINAAITADYVITAQSPGGPPPGFSASAVGAAATVPGVTSASALTYGRFLLGRSPQTLSSLAPRDLSTTVAVDVTDGRGAAALRAGELLVDATKARTENLKVGSTVKAVFAETGSTTMKVGGIFKPNALLGSLVVSSQFFSSHFSPTTLPMVLLVSVDGGASPQASKALSRGLGAYPNLEVKTRAAFEESQKAQVNQLLGLVYALLTLAILIAMIGIVNTLMLSVFERTREIGLLRAVGMKRRQVRTMIRTEAVILSIFGALIGITIGTGLGIALSSSLKDQGLTEISVPGANLIAFLVLAGFLGLVASTWPARRAAKLNILEAIAAE